MHKFSFYSMILRAPEGDPPAGGAGGTGGTGDAGGGQQQGGGGDAPLWFASHPDEGVRTFMQEQQILDPNVAATKLVNAHKALAGAKDVIALPGETATEEQRSAFYEALGRPKEAKDYDFALEGVTVDPTLEAWARDHFHKAGLSASAAKGLVGDWQKFVTEYQATQVAEAQVAEQKTISDLKTLHGTGFDKFVADGQKAYTALGLPQEHQDALAKAAGSAAWLSLMSALGKKMGGEAPAHQGGGGGGDIPAQNMTPEQARVEIDRLRGDQAFNAKYNDGKHPEHAGAVQRMNALYEKAEQGKQRY